MKYKFIVKSFLPFSLQSIVLGGMLLLLCPAIALSNGGQSYSGFGGQEVIVKDGVPYKYFDVSEEVVIDFSSNIVAVDYSIHNKSSHTESLQMLFPVGRIEEGAVGGRSCKPLGHDVSDYVDFAAAINDTILDISKVQPANLKLDKKYEKLKEGSCVFFQFKADIKPGKNQIKISYNLKAASFRFDTEKFDRLMFYYPIWPAGNWVSRFKKAIWRVVYPELVQKALIGNGWYRDTWGIYKPYISVHPESPVFRNGFIFTANKAC